MPILLRTTESAQAPFLDRIDIAQITTQGGRGQPFMMSKLPPPLSAPVDDDDLPPPPYSASDTGAPAPSSSPYAPTGRPSPATGLTSHISSHLSSHLSSLPARIRATQEAHSTNQAARDLDMITRLVPHVEAFLSDLGCLPRSPRAAELTLVPATAVPTSWALSGAAERQREGEVVRIVRVKDDSPAAGAGSLGGGGYGWGSGLPMDDAPVDRKEPAPEPTWNSSREFDSWGRWDEDRPDFADGAGGGTAGMWWWRDEEMAIRLAAYLQPKPPPARRQPQPVVVERQAVQAAVERAREERRGTSWFRRKSGEPSSSSSPAAMTPVSAPAPVPARAEEPAEDRVTMQVSGQEVTFRRENEFGVWESMSGFGIVVLVQMRRPR